MQKPGNTECDFNQSQKSKALVASGSKTTSIFKPGALSVTQHITKTFS